MNADEAKRIVAERRKSVLYPTQREQEAYRLLTKHYGLQRPRKERPND